MRAVHEIADFLWNMRARLRFGELSRMPLQLLRFEVAGTAASCEWIARQSDAWDVDVAHEIRNHNSTVQALLDAIAIREMLFSAIPQIKEAKFRVYRELEYGRDLIITGLVCREDKVPPRVSSPAMRAKLYGLHFSMQEGLLEPLQVGKESLQFAT
jgi:hypothetical protein